MKPRDVSLLSLLALLGFSACSKPETARMTGAATTPLSDLNLVRAKIPQALLAAQKAPYGPPADLGCEGLMAEVRQLDAALGPDLDAPPSTARAGLVDRGRAEAGGAALDAVKHTAEGLIPFRGWVRKLSGAERYSKLVTDAIAAGIVRRAYLKGLGQAQGCLAPAAPLRPSSPPVAPERRIQSTPQ
jgi:hypothetical protein